MQYHKIVKAEVLGFVLNNVEGFNIFDNIYIKNDRCSSSGL